jgi:diguanylate cyclase (GGDEF)-like protein
MVPQAVLPLLMNMLTATLFGISFVVIACLNPGMRRIGWMAASYGFGVLEPASHLVVAIGGEPTMWNRFAPCSFLIGLTLMAPALSLFYQRPPMWRGFGLIVGAGLVYFTLLRPLGREDLSQRLIFQSFFTASMMLCAATAWRNAPASAMNRVLVAVFMVTGLHFLAKPFLAARFGFQTDRDYLGSLYGVISQASTGVLLVAAGLLILIAVLQSIVKTHHDQARVDPLTGLPNRRALEEAFDRCVDPAQHRLGRVTMAVAILDLDHFKSINDRLGHDGGDVVLRRIAQCLDASRPDFVVPARLGGEEFVLLMPDHDLEAARQVCECIRRVVSDLTLPDLPSLSVSIGVTTLAAGDTLTTALRRADQALYEAKAAGRNCCVVAKPRIPVPRRPRLAAVGARA